MNHYFKEAIEDINQASASNKIGLATAIGALASGSVYGTQVADALMGDTHGLNSGEIPLNYILQSLGVTGGALVGAGIGGINSGKKGIEELLQSIPEVTKDASNVHARDIKGELQRILREEGETAAKQAFADQKKNENVAYDRKVSERNSKVAAAIQELKGNRGSRRMAGAALGALAGSGIAATQMVDNSY